MAAANKIKESDKEFIREMYSQGKTFIEIGRKLDVSGKTIEYHVRKMGVYDATRGNISSQDKELTIKLYAENVHLEEIARQTGVTAWTVAHRLKKWGIKLLGPERTKIVNRNNVSEEDVIAKYHELNSLSKTAEFFDTSEVTISKILNRHNVATKTKRIRDFFESNKSKLLERYRSGAGLITIAREIGISPSTVYLNFRRWGIAREYPKAKEVQRILRENKDDIYTKYFKDGLSSAELATQLGISSSRLMMAFRDWGWQCRQVFCNTSIERMMAAWLEEMSIEYRPQFELERKVYDFYLPKHKTFIEVHGDYWHGNPSIYQEFDEIQVKTQKRDRLKESLAQDNGYRLLVFWESDMKQNPQTVRSKIQQHLS